MSSTSLSRSPSSSAAISALSRSSARVLALPRDHLGDVGVDVVDRVERRRGSPRRVRIGSKVFTTAPDHSRSCDRSRPSGMPSISEITMNGSGNARLGDEVDVAAGGERDVEVLVDELLHARPELLDGARREHLGDQPAQPVMVGRVEVQHVVRAALAAARRAWPRCRDRASTASGIILSSSTLRLGSRSTRCTSS